MHNRHYRLCAKLPLCQLYRDLPTEVHLLILHRFWRLLWFWIFTCGTLFFMDTVVVVVHFRYFSCTCQLWAHKPIVRRCEALRMRNIIITLLILTFATSCSNRNNKETSERINFRFAILNLPAEEFRYITQDFANVWNPDTIDLIKAEQLIKKAVRTTEGELLSIQSLPNYFRQYVGFLNSAGERMLWVNALCDIKDGMVENNGEFELQPWPWKTEPIIVDDGGDCYWNILINIDKQEYSNFYVNGVA